MSKSNTNNKDYDCSITCDGVTIYYKSGHMPPEAKAMFDKMIAAQREETTKIQKRIEETKAETERIKEKTRQLHEKSIKLQEKNDRLSVKNNTYNVYQTYGYTGGKTMSYNQTINSVADARRAQDFHDFNKRVNDLHERIQHEIEWKQRETSPDLKQANAFLISEMKKLLEMPIHSDKDYEYVSWLFNYGKLRTESEINARKKAESDARYVLSGQYETDCFVNKSLWGWGGFLITFFIFLGLLWKELWILAVPIAALPALIASMIGMAIASKQNIDNAKEHGVPKSHPRLQHDKNELRMCGIGAAAAAGSIYHSGKKACKEIMDVEHWPKH